MTILSSGNVGIGTANPISLLNMATGDLVVGTTTALTTQGLGNFISSGVAGISNNLVLANDYFDGGTDEGNAISFQVFRSNIEVLFEHARIESQKEQGCTSGGGCGGALSFQVLKAGDTVVTEAIHIDDDADVGIGTGTPTHRLEVVDSAAAATGLSVEAGANGAAIAKFFRTGSTNAVEFSAAGNDAQISFTDGTDFWRIGKVLSGDSLRFSYNDRINNGADMMTILTTGSVGIGTVTPDATLEVIGDAVIGDEGAGLAISSVGTISDEGGDVVINDSLRLSTSDDMDIPDGYLCVENIGGTNCSGAVDGVVYADDFIEHSLSIPNEGLTAILGMKNKEDGSLDHSSFPSYIATTTEKGLSEGISLGSQIKYLIKGMQEQQEMIARLEADIEKLKEPVLGSANNFCDSMIDYFSNINNDI